MKVNGKKANETGMELNTTKDMSKYTREIGETVNVKARGPCIGLMDKWTTLVVLKKARDAAKESGSSSIAIILAL